MATEATFTVPADQFPLGTVFEQLPDVTVELERFIPARDVVIPYFWVRGTDVDDVAGAFTDHPGVKAIRFVDSVKDEHCAGGDARAADTCRTVRPSYTI